MDSLQIGDLTVTATANGIELALAGVGQSTVLPKKHLESLRTFLDHHAHNERRVGFRVPLRPLSDDVRDSFAVELSVPDQVYSAKAVDLSLTGILVKCEDNKLSEGDDLIAKLCLQNDCVLVTAKVVRRDANMVALHFPGCIKDSELDPPEALLNIYRTLELEWLKGRIHT